jgi:glycerate 2-kinase
MHEIVKNKGQILSHGDVEARRVVLELTERTLSRLNAYHRMKNIMRLEGDTLHIGVKQWDLRQKRNIYLVGAGKACNHMAMAVDEVLGDRLTDGIAIVKILEQTDRFNKTRAYVGGHPIPNEAGYRASLEILDLVDNAGPEDLFIAVISGGSSALMSCPIEGLSLEDEMLTTDIALKAGMNILELNAIRRHISRTNGGMLAKRIASRGAELIGFGISDMVGLPPTDDIRVPAANYQGTPIGPDFTTLDEARRVIHAYDLKERLPRKVVEYLMNCGEEGETPKAFPRNTYFLINTLPDACLYAKEVAKEMGLNAVILTSFLEGESREAGRFMASLARQIQTYGGPVAPPCVILSGGETTTRIADNSLIKGHGGPSQELTTGFAIAASMTRGVCMLSIDSEGTDGTTPVAGGITDSKTASAAKNAGVDLGGALKGYATYEALSALGDVVMTGNTGTNLCDFNVMYVSSYDQQEERA